MSADVERENGDGQPRHLDEKRFPCGVGVRTAADCLHARVGDRLDRVEDRSGSRVAGMIVCDPEHIEAGGGQSRSHRGVGFKGIRIRRGMRSSR